jgi:hypothetical protein
MDGIRGMQIDYFHWGLREAIALNRHPTQQITGILGDVVIIDEPG